MAKKLIKNYVFNKGLGLKDNANPYAVDLLEQNKIFIVKEIGAFIQNKIDAADPDYTDKTYDIAKCERDATYVIDALIFDIRYGGNEETRRISTYYWEEDVPQIAGNRIAEVESYTYAQTLITDFIFTNTVASSPEQNNATQITTSNNAETGTDTSVDTLLGDVVDVIENGLSQLPAQTIGLGRIELLGALGLEDLLIITNVTDNIVIYNFADSAKGGKVKFTTGNSASYPQAESVNNGTTVINFNFNTSAMSNDDEIQVFLEESELRVRMNSIATDAMERIKVGIPQAMLDADFEYGLQPTKWQAISTQRGYPSTYEIPASDILVDSVVTDASSGTNNVGASLITVTTSANHPFVIGDVFTIRALSSSILGFNRAEGTFIVQTVPSATTFTYYAKSKVGVLDGQVLATSNTQLRQAEFYTGAALSDPQFSIVTQGASGTFTASLQVDNAVSTIAFTGDAPPVGAVLSGTGIATGTQVSGVFGDNNVDGTETSIYVGEDISIGDTAITLANTTGISAGMAIKSHPIDPGNGLPDTGTNTQLVISSIAGNTLNLSGPLNIAYNGDVQTYSGIVLNTSNNVVGTGTGAQFDVTVDGTNVYSAVVNTAGSGYVRGDTIRILGSSLGGTSPTNDIHISVDDVNGSGGVDFFRIISSTTGASAATYSGVTTSIVANPFAANQLVNIAKNAGTYSGSGNSGGTGIQNGNRFLIPGTSLGGATPANDVTVTVTGITEEPPGSGTTQISTYTVSGTAGRGEQIDIYGTVTISSPTTQVITSGSSISTNGIAEVDVTFADHHGLVPGNPIMISVSSDDGSNNHTLVSGPFFLNTVPSATSFRITARSSGTIDVSTDSITANVYIRPDGFFTHRPFDGGVQLGTGSPQHGAQAVRQSKKYIRYQSGKGAMYNTGALFAPSFDVASVTSTATAIGSIITVNTDDADHGLQAGAYIKLNGVNTVGYDGEYTVNEIIDERTFTVVATSVLGSVTGIIGEQCQMSTFKWHGSVVRSGPYDDQNGIFWQYDGQELAVVRRSATFQVAGSVEIDTGSTRLQGTGTRFLDQLQEGDRIVIRGMTHVVGCIVDNEDMYITPAYRGINNLAGAKITKVQDLVIPQNEWNLDRCDGTGPSGYNIDITKMQMIGVQFTWYGAGFIDWMLRGPNGDYIFCHRLKGNNLNTEAYMRTGNLPVRYEVLNDGTASRLDGNLGISDTFLTLQKASAFPQSGVVKIDAELISYTGKTGNTLTGLSRSATLSNFAGGATRSYTGGAAAAHNDRQGVILVSGTTSPIISHWGSAYLIDGQFDDDRGYIFSYAATDLEISTVRQSSFLIRLAPSVSNAVTGDLGERELLNRAQLLLDSISVTSEANASGALIIEGVLNPQNYPENPSGIVWNGLNNASAGGQPSFAQVALGSSVKWKGGTTIVTRTATIAGALSANFTCVRPGPAFGNFNNDIQNNRNRFFLFDDLAATSGIEVGDLVGSNSFFPSGTFIERIITDWQGSGLTRYNTSEDASGTVNEATIDVTKDKTSSSYTGSNTLPFTDSTWVASGATVGTPTSQTEFPANTTVSGVTSKNIGTTQYYEVSFSQSFTGTLNAAATVEFNFTPVPFAKPGETVFSFIANPGETATLDLSALKELTTTTIGGRGTFPNGPDVLALNVYKTSGTATTGNVLLRWGEAQA